MNSTNPSEGKRLKKNCCLRPAVYEKLHNEMITRLQRGERCTISSLIDERLADSYNIL